MAERVPLFYIAGYPFNIVRRRTQGFPLVTTIYQCPKKLTFHANANANSNANSNAYHMHGVKKEVIPESAEINLNMQIEKMWKRGITWSAGTNLLSSVVV